MGMTGEQNVNDNFTSETPSDAVLKDDIYVCPFCNTKIESEDDGKPCGKCGHPVKLPA